MKRYMVQMSIIEKTKEEKTNYFHETYSAILNKISVEKANKLHQNKKFFRFLTFTNIFIDKNNRTAHFYVAGIDDLMDDFVAHASFDNLMRIDDMVVSITKIIPLDNLKEKETYLMKSDLVINNLDPELKRPRLCEDEKQLEERLQINIIKKCNTLGIEINQMPKVKILKKSKRINKYKAGHIFSWKCLLEIKADYEVVNAIYSVGIGENTSTGHGFMWEVR